MKGRKRSGRRRKSNSSSFLIKVSVVIFLFVITGVSAFGFTNLNKQRDTKSTEQKNQTTVEKNQPTAENKQSVDEANQSVEVNTIYKGVSVNNIDLSGLTVSEASDKLKEAFLTPLLDKTITINASDKNITFTYKDLNLTSDFTQISQKAYDYGKDGSTKERNELIKKLETTPYNIEFTPTFTCDFNLSKDKIKNLASDVYIKPVEPTVSRKDGAFSVVDGKDGRELDVDATFAKLMEESKKVNFDSFTVDGVIKPVSPKTDAKELKLSNTLIGSYKTAFKGSITDPRNVNLKTATERINNTVLAPGETFSTNKSFGERTVKNGYKIAPVIVSGTLVDGVGGGVCQVSSTLYNAVLRAELGVVSRQNHSLKVAYADYGFDATISGDVIDFKFKNNTDFPLFIESYLQENKVYVNLYGKEIHDPTRKLEFSSTLIDTFPPGAEKITEDPTLPLGDRKVKAAAKTGYKYAVYKNVYENNKLIEKVKVNESYYKPVRADVLVGTGTNVTPKQETANEVSQTTTKPNDKPNDKPKQTDSSAKDNQVLTPDVPVSQPSEEPASLEMDIPTIE